VTASKISGEDLDFSYEGKRNGIWGDFRSLPTTPSESTVTISCTWGGQTTTRKLHVHVVQPDFVFPTDVSIPGMDSNGRIRAKVGDELMLEPSVLPADFSGVPGFEPTYWCSRNLGEFADTDWSYQSRSSRKYLIKKSGIYQDTIGISYGALTITKNVKFIIADENGTEPSEPLSVSASFQQSNPKAGQEVGLNWTVSGGKEPYHVEIDWFAGAGIMEKKITTENWETSTGTSGYVTPIFADTLITDFKVTDSEGNKIFRQFGTRLADFDRSGGYFAYCGITNRCDYTEMGLPVSATWEITPGSFNVTNVRYMWVAADRVQSLTSWTEAGTALTGNATYTPETPGAVYLKVAFDTEEEWFCRGIMYDPIQILTSGDTPVTAEISITPENPKPGEDVSIQWNVGGTSNNTNILVTWSFVPSSGTPSSSSINQAVTTGTQTLRYGVEGHLSALVKVDDRDKGISISRDARTEIRNASGGTLALVPEYDNGTRDYFIGAPAENSSAVTYRTAQSRMHLCGIGIANYQQIKDQFSEDPSFTATADDETIQFHAERMGDGSGVTLVLDEIPSSAKDVTFTTTVTWDGTQAVNELTVRFVAPESLPDEKTMVLRGDPLVVKSGEQITPERLYGKLWTLTGYSAEFQTLTAGDGIRREYLGKPGFAYYAKDPGVYPATVSVKWCNILWKETFQLIVTNEEGTINATDYTPAGTVAELPANLTMIERQAFAGTKLTEIDIPEGVTSIAADAFDGTGLIAIYAHNIATVEWAVEHGFVAVIPPAERE